MARTRKSAKRPTKQSKSAETEKSEIEEAEIVSEEAPLVEDVAEPAPEPDAPAETVAEAEEVPAEDATPEPAAEDVSLEEPPTDVAAESTSAEGDEGVSEEAGMDSASEAPVDVVEDPVESAPPPVAPPPPAQSSNLVPMAVVGLLAGAIGAAIPLFLLPNDNGQETLSAEMSQLEGRIDELASTQAAITFPDISPLTEDIAALEAALSEAAAHIATLQARLTAVEERPVGDANVTEGDLIRLQETLEAQRAQSAALTEEIDRMARLQEEGLRNAETELLNEARAAANTAARQVLTASLANGAPFAEVVGQLSTPLPDAALAVAENGIPVAEDLQESYDALAREALAVARSEASGEGDMRSRLTTFFNAQVGARSVEPREGSDPDAVLSRAGAAVAAGDFATAVAELETLPNTALAVFESWLVDARLRASATAAITEYLAEE